MSLKLTSILAKAKTSAEAAMLITNSVATALPKNAVLTPAPGKGGGKVMRGGFKQFNSPKCGGLYAKKFFFAFLSFLEFLQHKNLKKC